MSVCVVTGYVPLPCDHRTRERYNELGGRLLDACPRSVLFRHPLEDCWLAKRLGGVEPGGKDTTAYHCVQHQKFQWLEDASMAVDADTLIWIDYGILHMPGMTESAVERFIKRAEQSPTDRIVSPSAGNGWTGGETPDWMFLGAVLVVPRGAAPWLLSACQQSVEPISWEVNTLGRVARSHPERFGFYGADHNVSILENYAC